MQKQTSVPKCLGFHSKPAQSKRPCSRCNCRELCQYVESNFVPKTALREALRIVQEIKAILRG